MNRVSVHCGDHLGCGTIMPECGNWVSVSEESVIRLWCTPSCHWGVGGEGGWTVVASLGVGPFELCFCIIGCLPAIVIGFSRGSLGSSSSGPGGVRGPRHLQSVFTQPPKNSQLFSVSCYHLEPCFCAILPPCLVHICAWYFGFSGLVPFALCIQLCTMCL